MRAAIKVAQRGLREGEVPIGAVVVYEGKVISRGYNRRAKLQLASAHAEMMAIDKACKKFGSWRLPEGCELYVTLEPCPMCMGAILWANIDKVYYGCNIVDTEEIGFRDKIFYEFTPEKKKEMVVELDREECLKLYQVYKNLAGKTEY